MVYSKVVYIYIEGSDFQDDVFKQKAKHEKKWADTGEFIFVKYKGRGHFEYTQNGKAHFGLPSIDADTKIVVIGHGAPKSHQLSQLVSGGGIQLSVQTIADAIIVPKDQEVRLSLRGCNTGVGESRDSHEDSFAGQLFAKLTAKGLKPHISASLSYTWMLSIGRLGRFVAMEKVSPLDGIARYYERLARESYSDNFPTRDAFEKFQIIQRHRRIVGDSRARGSKVVLTDNQGSMEAYYPYGCPNERFDVDKLGGTGLSNLLVLLSKEGLWAQKFKFKLDMVKKELSKIFVALEEEMEQYPMEKTEEYSYLKKFLLEEDYYFDIEIIAKMMIKGLDRTSVEGEQCYLFFVNKINENALLRNFVMDAGDIEAIYDYNDKTIKDFYLAYEQFGWEIVCGKLDFPSPILAEQLELLDASTRRALLIALGKQMVIPGYQLDKLFVQTCIVQAQQREEEIRVQAEKQLYWESGIESLREEGLEDIYTQLLDESMQQRFVIELGKQRQWQDYDQECVDGCKDLIRIKLVKMGSDLINQEGGCHLISLNSFRFLDEQEQELVAFFIGWQDLAGSLSEGSQMTMENLIGIAREREQLAASSPERRDNHVVSRFNFLPPVAANDNRGQQRDDVMVLTL